MQFRAYRDGPTRGPSRVRTQRTTGAVLTVCGRELDLDDLVLAVVNGGRPADTGVAFWARRLRGLPVDDKMPRVKASLLLGLPFDIGARRTNQVNAIILLAAVQ